MQLLESLLEANSLLIISNVNPLNSPLLMTTDLTGRRLGELFFSTPGLPTVKQQRVKKKKTCEKLLKIVSFCLLFSHFKVCKCICGRI